MIWLIVTGHGNFATGLTSSLKLIAGDPQNYVAVDFPQEYSVEDLERELTKALDSLKDCDGILVLSDLGGGSPFKTAVMVGYPRGNVEVLAGTNLPMPVSYTHLKKIYFCNAMTQPGETDHFSVEDHIRALQRRCV